MKTNSNEFSIHLLPYLKGCDIESASSKIIHWHTDGDYGREIQDERGMDMEKILMGNNGMTVYQEKEMKQPGVFDARKNTLGNAVSGTCTKLDSGVKTHCCEFLCRMSLTSCMLKAHFVPSTHQIT